MLLAGSGCGGDDERDRAQDAAPRTDTALAETDTTETRTTTTESDPGTETEAGPEGDGHGGGHETPGSPEDQPGGAGDEEPARTEALLTGRDGRISPRLVRVPPFLAVRVTLRSADEHEYALRIAGRMLRAGGALASVSVELAGLRPGKAYVGTELETGAKVRVEASAEPGP